MKRRVLLSFAVAVLVAVAGVVAAEKEDGEHKCPVSGKCAADGKCPLSEAKCPISGKPVSKDASVDYKGGKVFFCCGGCPAAFEKDKAKYETKANLQLAQTGQVEQTGCPLSGGKVNPDTKIKVCGVEVGFCCNGCKGKVVAADEAKQCEMVFASKNFDKAFKAKEKK